MPTLTDLSTIRDLCARYDFALSKGFGQNFIINPGICPRIAEAAGIGPGWGALEVGPGIGVLTEQLCKRADKVVSIEVDKRLPPILAETMAEYENFKLVLEDVLKVVDQAKIPELNEYQCGTYQMHSLAEAHEIARTILARGVGINKNAELALPSDKLASL